jgi:hypothetical protein
MHAGGMFWIQMYYNPDNWDGDGPLNVGEFQPFNMAGGLRKI